MFISNMAIGHRTTVMILIVLIMVAGSAAYLTLPRESEPDVEFPFIMVLTSYEGASPEDMETLITRPIERKLNAISEIKEMMSVSSEGLSTIMLEFNPDMDIDTALQKVRDKVDEADPDLPDDLQNDPSVKEISAQSEFPVLFVNISGEVGLVRLKGLAEDIEEDIEDIKGVLDVDVLGGLEREIRVEFDQDRLAAYSLTLTELIETIASNNVNTPGGSLEIGEGKFSVKAPAEFTSPEEIDNLVVTVRNGKPIYLTDVARIRDTFKDRDSFSRLDGEESVTIKVTKRSGENLLRISEEVKAILDGYRADLPPTIKLTLTGDRSEDVDMMIGDLENSMGTGLILVLLVIFVALGLRNAVLVAVAIPLSMLISFFVLQVMDFTLNIVVLFSLILALGMLVDNAIVIVENIYRHHASLGKPLMQAARDGTQEVAWPVIASTATTVVAFAPLAFWPGIMGEFMGYLPRTVITTLLASLFVALVINPALCSKFIRKARRSGADDAAPSPTDDVPRGPRSTRRSNPIIRGYLAMLGFGLRYRVLVLLFFFALLVLAIMAFGMSGLGMEMFPDTEPKRIVVEIEAPEGTNIYRTNQFARQAEEIIGRYGNIKHVTTNVGSAGQDTGPHLANINIDLVDREERRGPGDEGIEPAGPGQPERGIGPEGRIHYHNSNRMMGALREDVTAGIVGAKVSVDKMEEGPPVGAPVNVEIRGDDYDVLARLSERLQARILELRNMPAVVAEGADPFAALSPRQKARVLEIFRAVAAGAPDSAAAEAAIVPHMVNIQGVVDLTDDYNAGLPELTFEIDKERAALLGLNSYLIGQVIKAAVNGIKVGDYREGEDEYDITARLPADQRESVADILRLSIPDLMGNQVPLTSVAELKQSSGLAAIRHIDQDRVVTVSSNVAENYNAQQVLAAVRAIADGIQTPAGYAFRYTGENEEFEESQRFISKAFVAALLLILLVLVTQFDSIVTPVIIMVSVILSIIGVLLGLILTNQAFSVIMTGMGVISLAGVVVNNAIVLIDYTNLLRHRGKKAYDAIIDAAATRFRPVLLTAITTVLGMIPMAVGISFDFRELQWDVGSESSQWWGSMATAVIFGLVVATALTLFVVPNLYSLIFDFGLFRRIERADRLSRSRARRRRRQSIARHPESTVPQPQPAHRIGGAHEPGEA